MIQRNLVNPVWNLSHDITHAQNTVEAWYKTYETSYSSLLLMCG